jgi:hypothetical protein
MATAVQHPSSDRAQADDAVAFRHLLHEVASHITGLGLTLEMLGEPGIPPEDTTAMLLTARSALDDLRYLIADVGELTRFLRKHGARMAEKIEAGELLADLERGGVPLEAAQSAALPPIRADRAVVTFVLQMMAKTCRRKPGVAVTGAAVPVGTGFVRIEVRASYPEDPHVRRALEKAPLVVDHFCNAIARDVGGRFVREHAPDGQRIGFVLPVA